MIFAKWHVNRYAWLSKAYACTNEGFYRYILGLLKGIVNNILCLYNYYWRILSMSNNISLPLRGWSPDHADNSYRILYVIALLISSLIKYLDGFDIWWQGEAFPEEENRRHEVSETQLSVHLALVVAVLRLSFLQSQNQMEPIKPCKID